MKLSNKIGIIGIIVAIIGIIITVLNNEKGVIQKTSENAPAFNDVTGGISINYGEGSEKK